ncbi:MAG: sensor histidine kinase [Planctomycetota bacterium]|jgi:PAS domain S-box-containing protein
MSNNEQKPESGEPGGPEADTGKLRTELDGLKVRLTEANKKNTELVRNTEHMLSFQARLSELRAVKSEDELFSSFSSIVHDYVQSFIFAIIECEAGSARIKNVRFSSDRDIDFESRDVLDPKVLEWVATQKSVATEPTPGKAFTEKGIRTVILAPLIGRTKFLGILVMALPAGGEEISLFTETLVNTFAREVGTVLENLSLQSELLGMHSLLENVLESVPHAIIAIGPDNRIIALNRNFEFLFGVKRFECLYETYQSVLPAPVSEMFTRLTVSTIAGHKAIDEVIEFEMESGIPVTIGISTSLLVDRSKKPLGLVFVCRDMALSREVQKLRDLDKMRNEFVQTASHELKTPLTTILGGIDILNLGKEVLPEEQLEVVRIIESGATRLQDLINDLLQITRLESQEPSDLNWEKVNLRQIANESVEMLSGEGKHEFAVNIAEDIADVDADRDKLTMVFENLIGNAVKYSPEGGKITIAAEPEEKKVHVSVMDEGIGIPEDQVPYVWDKFFRTEAASDKKIEGTGLGLSIVKYLVELHGGEVWAESEEGKGSTFHFRIPVRREGS